MWINCGLNKKMKPIPKKTTLFSFDLIIEKADLQKGQIVAEFGCGKSLFFLYALLTLVGKEGMVYGVDIMPDIIETIKREVAYHNIIGIVPILGNLDSKFGVNIPEKKIDRGFLINTMHQSSDTITMLSEASRMIVNNGLLVVVDWDKDRVVFGPNKEQRADKTTIKEVAKIIKLELIDEFSPGAHHYCLIFRK